MILQAIGTTQEAELRISRAADDGDLPSLRASAQRLRGVVLMNVAKLRATSSRVYSLSSRSIAGAGDRNSWAREWKHLESDLLALAAAGSAEAQARIAARVHRTYLVFRA